MLRPRVLALLLCCTVAPLTAQDAPVTTDLLDRFVTAYDKEREDLAALDPQLREIDDKIRRFRECKTAFEAAGSATRSRLGGLAARAGIRARCGANNEQDIANERDRLQERVTASAAQAGGFSVPEFSRWKTRLERIYGYGDRAGLSAAELEALDARAERFASIFGSGHAVAEAMASMGAGGGMPGGRPMAGQWTPDLSWLYINQMFGMMYATGASAFDSSYAPGQWTRWRMSTSSDEEAMILERAFISRSDDGNEWWRFKMTMGADTATMEAMLKPIGDGMQQVVRMRARMPGDTEANELMVPQDAGPIGRYGIFGGMRPTAESLAGATVGTGPLVTPAGSFTARHVRYGAAGGRQEWWLSDQVPGGWLKYQVTGNEADERFTMELLAHGTGATSELGSRD